MPFPRGWSRVELCLNKWSEKIFLAVIIFPSAATNQIKARD